MPSYKEVDGETSSQIDYDLDELDREARTDESDMPEPTLHESDLNKTERGKFNQEKANEIITFLNGGALLSTAAAAANISTKALNKWIKDGKAGRTFERREFYIQVLEAMAVFEISMAGNITQAAANGNWQAAAWILERRLPEKWGRKRLEIDGSGNPSAIVNVNLDKDKTRKLWERIHGDGADESDAIREETKKSNSIEIPIPLPDNFPETMK